MTLAAALLLAGCGNHTPGYGNFGVDDNAAVHVTGWYPQEKNPDGTAFRWTNGDASYAVDPVAGAPPPHTLAITVNAFHPTMLRIIVSGKPVASQPLNIGRWSGTVDLSAIDFGKRQVIELASDRWIPEKVNGYTRPLGVQVIDLELR